MALKQIVDEALNTPMSRKEFLAQVGTLLLAVIGITSILHALSTNSHKGFANATRVSHGYGASVYGGGRE